MSVSGHIGIRLQVDPNVLVAGVDEVISRVAEVVGERWHTARDELQADGFSGDAVSGTTAFVWTGPDAGQVLPGMRERIESRLRAALAGATPRLTALDVSGLADALGIDPGASSDDSSDARWTATDVEFRAVLSVLIGSLHQARTTSQAKKQLGYLEQRYADFLDQPASAVATVVDVHEPSLWRTVVGDLQRRATDRFGGIALYFYFWDPSRLQDLIELDRPHLAGMLPSLTAPSTQPPEGVDFTVVPGTRVVFVSFGLPELTLDDVVFVGEEVEVRVPLHELIVQASGLFPWDEVTRVFGLSESDQFGLLQEWGDFPVPCRIVPLTPRRAVSIGSLKILMHEQARALEAHAATFGQLRLLTRGLLAEAPTELAEAMRRLADDVLIGTQRETPPPTHWRTNARGVYVYPLLSQTLPGLRDRIKTKAYIRDQVARSLLAILAIADAKDRSDALGRLIDDDLGRSDWLLFEVLLDELAKHHAVAPFFDAVRTATGWYYENTQRRYRVTRLANPTRYAQEPALLQLIEALRFHGFESSAIQGPHHGFDVPGQSVLLLGKSSRRVVARNTSHDDKMSVVAEVDDYYMEKAKVLRPKPELLARLSKPARHHVGEIVRRMACSSSETLTEHELMAEAMKAAMNDLKPPPEEFEFEGVMMRSSWRILALEEPLIDGVPQLRLRVEPVSQIGDGPWEATGKPELITPGQFEARLTVYHVQHMVTALTIGLMAVMAVTGAYVIVAAGIAGLGEVLLMIVFNEVVYLWTTPAEERSAQGLLEAALFAELQVVGFKMLAFGAAPLKLLAGRAITGRFLGQMATKWIAFGLRSVITAAEVAGAGVLDLFANDLFHMTRCRGMSSPDAYWERLKSGFKMGLLFEFAVFPGLSVLGRAPGIRVALGKTTTFLDAVKVLRDAGLEYRVIAADVIRGQSKLAQTMDLLLENASAKRAVIEGCRRTSTGFLQALKRELLLAYEPRAYRALFELMDVKLDAVAGEGLARLLAGRTEREIDLVLQKMRALKVPPADLLQALGRMDAKALAEWMQPGALNTLAQSPKVLNLLKGDPAAVLGMLNESFGASLAQFEDYLGQLEKLPPPNRLSVLQALLEHNPLPPEMLRNAALKAPLSGPTLTRLRAALDTIDRLDGLIKTGGFGKLQSKELRKLAKSLRRRAMKEPFDAAEKAQALHDGLSKRLPGAKPIEPIDPPDPVDGIADSFSALQDRIYPEKDATGVHRDATAADVRRKQEQTYPGRKAVLKARVSESDKLGVSGGRAQAAKDGVVIDTARETPQQYKGDHGRGIDDLGTLDGYDIIVEHKYGASRLSVNKHGVAQMSAEWIGNKLAELTMLGDGAGARLLQSALQGRLRGGVYWTRELAAGETTSRLRASQLRDKLSAERITEDGLIEYNGHEVEAAYNKHMQTLERGRTKWQQGIRDKDTAAWENL